MKYLTLHCYLRKQCSIDALLEKTIKHMLFLQSVTKHADKLKETGEPKVCVCRRSLHIYSVWIVSGLVFFFVFFLVQQ